MKNLQNLFPIILLVAFISFSLSADAQGDRLPNVTLTKADGGQINLADLGSNGKITIVNFWATWCTPCKKELNNIAEFYEEWQEDYNVELIAVSIDDARNTAKVKSYVAGQGWDYTVLLDPNQQLKRELGFQTIPFTILSDQSGVIVDKHTGYVEGDEYLLMEKLEKLSN